MKKLTTLILFLTILAPQMFAETTTVKTFTPFTPQQYYNYNNGRQYNPYYYPQRYNNGRYYNNQENYDNYRKRRNVFRALRNTFGQGQMTGYTPQYNNTFDNPYGYQKGVTSSNGDYYYNNYDQQNGLGIKILD